MPAPEQDKPAITEAQEISREGIDFSPSKIVSFAQREPMTDHLKVCATCAHWVVARKSNDPRFTWYFCGEFVPVEQQDGMPPGLGECDRASSQLGKMIATCDGDGAFGELKTYADFGCNEHAPAPEEWDHYRSEIHSRGEDGRWDVTIDDMAHVEGRA